MKYRSDIDCFRTLAVFLVLLFHCGFQHFENGYLGVDIFFVISGYVMFCVTSSYKWSFQNTLLFYQKRLLRIYPALLVMLVLSIVFGAVIMSTTAYDYLGKQVVFAALSISNILFSEGKNYFDLNSPLLLHTWSLGVEMQFYLIFPFFMVALSHNFRGINIGIFFLILVLILSLVYAANTDNHNKLFFLTHSRIFEFLCGVLAAYCTKNAIAKDLPKITSRSIFFALCAGLLCIIMLFKEDWKHPGIMTLIPVLYATCMLMIFAHINFYEGIFERVNAYIGRLSYGIYIYHFPVTILSKEVFFLTAPQLLILNIFITVPLAYISYVFIETPIRRRGYKLSKQSITISSLVILFTLTIAASGLFIAKQGGIPQRLQYLNTFSYNVSQQHERYQGYYTRGFDIKDNDNTKILFIGDSVLQQYIYPISKALGYAPNQIDSVTRGGCLLLKGVNFQDSFSDISCNHLREEKLYKNINKHYDYIVISQAWLSYQDNLLNPKSIVRKGEIEYLIPFLDETIDHFKNHAKSIIIIGMHPTMQYNQVLNIGPTLTNAQYKEFQNSLRPIEYSPNQMKAFDKYKVEENVNVIHAFNIFCNHQKQCRTGNKQYSYFADSEHLTKPGQDFALISFKQIFQKD